MYLLKNISDSIYSSFDVCMSAQNLEDNDTALHRQVFILEGVL